MKEYHILSLGAGVQSTMLYLLACEQHPCIGKIDYAIFADTGDEPEAVYDHLKWLQALDGPEILVRSKGNLGDDLMYGCESRVGKDNRLFSAIPAFTAGGGLGQRQCTYDYKIAVVEQTIRREIVGVKPRKHFPKKDVHVHQYIGISLDECSRIVRIRKRFAEIPWATVHFPLYETKTTRKGCSQWLKSRVPHKVPRSSCVECPFHSNEEWQRIKSSPRDWERACQIDEALRDQAYLCGRGMDELQFLHRSLVPLREADLSTPPQTGEFGFVHECEGMCGV
ncbi:hypothetical protein [Pontiella sp.]|uniref:hypothetical protein n=1 Tax=Pontiella sp. TaxID=2837462 RepID=UPI003569811D